MKKPLLFSIFLAQLIGGLGTVHAQFYDDLKYYSDTYPRHDIGVAASAGYSSFLFNMDGVNRDLSWGGTLGVSSQIFFTKQWGIGFSLEFRHIQGAFHCPTLQTNYLAEDSENEEFLMDIQMTNLKERLSSFGLTIPFLACFESGMIFARAGAFIHFPLKSSHFSSLESVKTRAYFDHYDLWLEGMPWAGFGDYNNLTSMGSTKLKMMYGPHLEFGIQLPVGDRSCLRISLIGRYTANNILTESRRPVVEYQAESPETPRLNSLIYNSPNAIGSSTELSVLKHLEITIRVSFALQYFVRSDF